MVVNSRTICGEERRLNDPQRPFTRRWLQYAIQRSLTRVASMPATGHNRPLRRSAQYPCKQSSGQTRRRVASKWMQCTRRSAAFMNVFGATACAIDPEIWPRTA